MNWQYTPYVVPLFAAAALSAVLALYSWRRRHTVVAAGVFAWLMLAVAAWTLGYVIEVGGTTLASTVLGAKIEYLGVVTTPVAWLFFALAYTGRERWLTRRNLGLLLIQPALTLVLVWTTEVHGLMWDNLALDTTGPFPAMTFSRGLWYWVNVGYGYLLLLLGALLFLQIVFRAPRPYRQQATLLLLSALPPWIGNVLWTAGLNPIPNLELGPLAFTLTGLMVALGLFHFRLLDIVPVARHAVVESMSDAVLVLDAQNRIVDLNPAARRIVGQPGGQIIGHSAAQVLSPWAALMERYQGVTEAHDEIVLHTGETPYTYDLRLSPLRNRLGRLTGRLVILHDVTERVRAETTLRESEERYRRLVDILPEGIVVHSEGKIVFVNPLAARLIDVEDPDQLIDKPALEFVHPDYREIAVQRIQQALTKGGPVPLIREKFLKLDGTSVDVEVTATPFTYQGKPAMLTIVRDVTEQVHAEQERHERERFVRLVNEITQAAISSGDLASVLQTLADRMGELLHADGCYITLWDEATGRTIPMAAYGAVRDIYANFRVDPDEPTVTRSLQRERRPLAIEDVYDTPYLSPRIAGLFPDRSLLGLPLIADGRYLGAALIAYHEPHVFSADELAYGEQAAAQVALAVAKAHALETEKEQRALAEALERAAAAISSTLDFDQVLDRILEQVQQVVGGDAANFMLVEKDRARIVRWRGYERFGSEDYVSRATFDIAQTANLRQMMETGEAIIIPDTGNYPGWIPVPEQSWIRSYASVPIRVRDDTTGFLCVDSVTPDFFTPDHARRLQAFASHAAIAIENAQLHRELQAYSESLARRVAERTADVMEEKERSEAILRSVGEAIVMTDPDLRIQYVNAAFSTMTGFTAAEALGQPVHGLIGIDMSEANLESIRTNWQEGLPWQGQVTARCKDGRTYEASLDISPMHNAQGNVIGYVFSHRDISRQKALERARNQFLSNVSHQLRTPVTNLKLYTHILTQGISPGKTEHYLQVLAGQVDQLAHLIQDIVEMTVLDSGQEALFHWRTISPSELAEQIDVRHRRRANAADLTLTVEPPPSGLAAVEGDEKRLVQALDELVENAIVFTPAGGQVMVEFGAAEADGRSYVTVAVRDTGPGIAPEEQARVFERFFRGKLAESGTVPGTGLGLSIAYEIARAHGGKLTVESQEGAGSSFTLWLPTK